MNIIKKSGYRYQIKQELLIRNWEIIEIDSNSEWWDDESWKVRLKYNTKVQFYLCFIVDPQLEGVRKKGQGIYEVKASTQFPKSWNDDEHTVASICMSKQKFNLKLNVFISNIENYKKECISSRK